MNAPTITNLPVSGKWTFNQSTRRLYFRGSLIRCTFFDSRPSGIHGAVDVGAANFGDDLRALIKQKIARVGNEGSGGWGRYLRGKGVDGHDYLRAHFQRVTVRKGQWVAGGAKLGDCDCSGNCNGSHDHLEKWWVSGDRDTRVDLYWELCWLTENLQGKKKHANPYPTPSTSRKIQRGDVGVPVMWVQWSLAVDAVNGRFGPGMVKAVKAFQKKRGLSQTGVVDKATHARLKAVWR